MNEVGSQCEADLLNTTARSAVAEGGEASEYSVGKAEPGLMAIFQSGLIARIYPKID